MDKIKIDLEPVKTVKRSKSDGTVNIRKQFVFGANSIESDNDIAIKQANNEVELYQFLCNWINTNIEGASNYADTKKCLLLALALKQGYKLVKSQPVVQK